MSKSPCHNGATAYNVVGGGVGHSVHGDHKQADRGRDLTYYAVLYVPQCSTSLGHVTRKTCLYISFICHESKVRFVELHWPG